MPRSPFMIDSLAEHVPGPVITNTRPSPSDGSGWPLVADKPTAVAWNGSGVIGCPVTGSIVGYLSLNASCSKVFPFVAAGPAIMKASSLAMTRNPPPL